VGACDQNVTRRAGNRSYVHLMQDLSPSAIAPPAANAPRGRSIQLSTLIACCAPCFLASGLAVLCIWLALEYSKQDLVEGLPVVTAWMNAAGLAFIGVIGAVVCLLRALGIGDPNQRSGAIAFCTAALLVAIVPVGYILALPFL
jgi:hypothetical protein